MVWGDVAGKIRCRTDIALSIQELSFGLSQEASMENAIWPRFSAVLFAEQSTEYVKKF